ncbi:MAG: exonuclease SbcCD subunit D C-terminal domain-containing protein [Synergistaceae bacterium]|jgi:exonuclease SbcD|nr:exonuclease SbcCD subunit D C-terminal domain-containing protein [Synergistaceae bacterium]
MKILHTSDWHLGRTLYGKKRYAEFEAFLDWLPNTLAAQKIDVLLVTGDIFDTTTPSNRAQQLYYQFLCRVNATGCRHVVIVGGNHDSPSFLDAPRELLSFLDIHVVGAPAEKIKDELLTLRNPQGEPELLVCAVPYLRDRDLRSFEAGESPEEKEARLIEGIRNHYREIAALAAAGRNAAGGGVPVVGTGHLFAAGGKSTEGDGVRELYVGSLAHVGADCFPDSLDYLALGHLHAAQKVGNSEFVRYSGAPLIMSPSETEGHKSVTLVELGPDAEKRVELIPVPVFQALERIAGDMDTLETRLNELRLAGTSSWLEIVYEGRELVPDLQKRVNSLVAGSNLEILRVKNSRAIRAFFDSLSDSNAREGCELLSEMDVTEVFTRCLDRCSVPPEQRPELLDTYREVLSLLDSKDPLSE